jgi:cellulose synthase operon protein YhjQ
MASSTLTDKAPGRESEPNPFEGEIPVINENGRTTGVVTDVDTLNTLVKCIGTLEDLLQTKLIPAAGAAAGNPRSIPPASPPLRTVTAELTPAQMKQAAATAVTLAAVAPIIQTSVPPPVSIPRLRAVKNDPVSAPPQPRSYTSFPTLVRSIPMPRTEEHVPARPASIPPPAQENARGPISLPPYQAPLGNLSVDEENFPTLQARAASLPAAEEKAPAVPGFVSAPLQTQPAPPERQTLPPKSFAPRALGRLPKSNAGDVNRLFSQFGCNGFEYREVAHFERGLRSAAEANVALAEIALPGSDLAKEVTGPLGLEKTPGPRDSRPGTSRRRRSVVQMPTFAKDPRIPWTVAVVSTRPGIGRTTVAANLAVALAQDVWRSVAISLDARNDLPAHFGMDPSQKFGVANMTQPIDHIRWHNHGVSCIPFGATDVAALTDLDSVLAEDDRWLEKRLLPLSAGSSELWVLDTPANNPVLLRQALSLSDLVLVVLSPDAETSAGLAETDATITEHTDALGKNPPCYVMNRFDSRRSLDRHTLSAVRGVLRDRLAPTIHEDVSVQETLDAGRLLVQTAAYSQVVADLAALADWLNSRRAADESSRSS